MADIASLQIRIESLEALTAEKRLKGLETQGRRNERANSGLASSSRVAASAVAAIAAAGVTAVASLGKVTSVTREFDVLNAQLITATGSAEKAAGAFEAIQDFATQTPYDLAQVTEGFTKLVNLGLTPSERALESYGDTASSMGKDLNQLIEAVADAATGEFERLKEFGIKAKSEGDNVALTFRGVTTTVRKNAAEIEEYLIALGENNFAGAMAERMNTLDGAISNLADEWNKLWLNISNQGVGDLIESSVRAAIGVLEELNALLASGQIQGYLTAIASKFEGFGQDIVTSMGSAIDLIGGAWEDLFGDSSAGGIAYAAKETVSFIIDAFVSLPENIRAIVQIMGVEFGAIVDYGKAYGGAFVDAFSANISALVDKAKAYGKAIGQALNPFSEGSFDLSSALAEIDATAQATVNAAYNQASEMASITRQARLDSIQSILDEKDAALGSFDAQIQAATDLRTAYDQAIEARRNGGTDRLAQFSQGAANDPTSSASPIAQTASSASPRNTEFEQLQDSLRTEEEAILESYRRRQDIILENTEEGSQKRQELLARLNEQHAENVLGDFATPDTYQEQLDSLAAYYDQRVALAGDNTELLLELERNYSEQVQQLEAARMQNTLAASSDLFGSLADLSKNFSGETSKTYRALFAASKAFSVAQSVIAIQTGLAQAAAQPYPANLVAMGTVAAQTASIVSTIQGTNYSGAYDKGGNIPAGSFGLVGEYGPELIQGPTNVMSRKDTAQVFNDAKNGTPAQQLAQQIALTINNYVDPEIVRAAMEAGQLEDGVMNIIRDNAESVRSIVNAA